MEKVKATAQEVGANVKAKTTDVGAGARESYDMMKASAKEIGAKIVHPGDPEARLRASDEATAARQAAVEKKMQTRRAAGDYERDVSQNLPGENPVQHEIGRGGNKAPHGLY